MVSPVDYREWRLRLRGFTVPVDHYRPFSYR